MFKDHPMRQVPNWKERAVPITLHGDGVPCNKLKLCCNQWWSLLAACFGVTTIDFIFFETFAGRKNDFCDAWDVFNLKN